MTNIEKDNKIPLSMLKISFLDKSPFKGSYKGMRYIIKKDIQNVEANDLNVGANDSNVMVNDQNDVGANACGTLNVGAVIDCPNSSGEAHEPASSRGEVHEPVLKVYTYKDLYNFENSEDIKEAEFSYDKDGIQKALEYLDEKVKEYN